MSLNQTLNEKVVPVVMKFVNLKGVQALKDGMLYTLPLNIIGSIFLLIACFPCESIYRFLCCNFWTKLGMIHYLNYKVLQWVLWQ